MWTAETDLYENTDVTVAMCSLSQSPFDHYFKTAGEFMLVLFSLLLSLVACLDWNVVFYSLYATVRRSRQTP